MTNKDRNYRLRCISGLWTLLTRTKRGEEVASIILPSECEPKGSPTRVYINDVTGQPVKADDDVSWYKPSTALEIEDAEYRTGARENARQLQSLPQYPVARFSLTDRLDDWCTEVTATHVRLFHGGDACLLGGRGALLCIAACAKRHPDKLFFVRTSSVDSLSGITNLENKYDMELPVNMLMFVEDLGTEECMEETLEQMESDVPILRYSNKGEDDLSFFPTSDDDCTIRTPKCCYNL